MLWGMAIASALSFSALALPSLTLKEARIIGQSTGVILAELQESSIEPASAELDRTQGLFLTLKEIDALSIPLDTLIEEALFYPHTTDAFLEPLIQELSQGRARLARSFATYDAAEREHIRNWLEELRFSLLSFMPGLPAFSWSVRVSRLNAVIAKIPHALISPNTPACEQPLTSPHTHFKGTDHP